MLKDISPKTNIRTSLIITIPLLISVLVLGTSLFYFYVVQQFFTKLEADYDIIKFKPIFDLLKIWMKIFVAGSFILGIILAYAITIPIKKLTLGTKYVTDGDFTKSVKISSEDELGMLGKSFNSMVTSLNEHIIESMTGGVITINIKGQVTTFNTAAELILGYDYKEVVGKPVNTLFENTSGNKDFIEIIKEAIKNNKTSSSKEIYIASKTGKKILIGITTSLLKDKNNTVLGIIVTFKDLRQIKLLEQQMRRADRLAAVGSLAAGVAHEIRNPLGSIKGLVQLLQEDLSPIDPKRAYTDVVLREVDRLNKVVEDLLSFARPEQESPDQQEKLDINQILGETLLLARHDSSNIKIKIETQYSKALPQIPADAKKLQQAFLNIIFNALHAMEENGGTLTIITKKAPDENAIEIHFIDTGIGIAEDIINKLFDPFFTTRKGGTGLGLTITHQIITAHKGKIDVRSEAGKGAEFIISLPVKT